MLIFVCSVSALAQSKDAVKLSAGYGLQTDSNLFRLPASRLALGGISRETEHIHQASLGLSVNEFYSLQRFALDVNLIDFKYKNSSYLNYVARNASTGWLWSITPHLHGNLTTSQIETLTSFADNQAINVRNIQKITNTRFDATYDLTGAWSVLGGVTSKVQSSVQPLAAEGETSTIQSDVGLNYAWASGSKLSYAFKNSQGKYTNRVLDSQLLFDDRYNQKDNELKLQWIFSGKSTFEIKSSYISRTHPHFSERNYSGFNTAGAFNWDISGKSALALTWARELSSYQDSTTNFTRTNSLSLSPTWQISAKTAIKAAHTVAIRNFLDSPSRLNSNTRSDITRDTHISLVWLPYQNITLSTSLQNIKRQSNQAGLDYKSNIATLKLQYKY